MTSHGCPAIDRRVEKFTERVDRPQHDISRIETAAIVR